ncbi:tape measure protein [Pseudomonas fulva]|uniref:tape measure protein n=1 Tax=Pseudomonas fulva TaxID=47880 RepID=UPI000CE97052|nr:tape measure protein [Pseudomonas fulva]AVF54968.1 hypothetical protein AL527_07200 [Pseudomonas fulva]
MIVQDIAQLTGRLKFVSDTSQLTKFMNKMEAAGNRYNHLGKMLAKALVLPAPDTKAFDKALAAYDHKLARQANAEAAVSNQRNKLFKREVAQHKLLSAGTKEDKRIQLPSMESTLAAAVAKAKARAQFERDHPEPKKRGRPASPEKQLLQEKLKLARLEAIHAKALQQSMVAQAKLAGQMTKNQLAAIVLEAKKADQITKEVKERHRVEDRASRQARMAENHSQRQERFKWAQDRQAHWQAAKNAPRGFLGRAQQTVGVAGELGIGGGIASGLRAVSGFAAALGPAGLALAGLTVTALGLGKAFSAMDEIAQKREDNVKVAEAYNASFNALSQDPNVRMQWRKRFMESQISTGGAINVDTAKDFRTFAATQQAFGKSMNETIKSWEQRGKAYTIVGASQDDRRELNRQLNQMQSDGTGDKADWNIISERAPMLAPYIAKQYAKESNVEGSTEQMMAAFTKSLKKGKGFRYSWVEGALNALNADKDAAFQEGLKSVTNKRQQNENQKFLRDNLINSDKETIQVLQERIAAQDRLNEAMLPFNEAGREIDKVFASATTSLIGFGAATLDLIAKITPGMKTTKERQDEVEKKQYQVNYRTASAPSPLKDANKEDIQAMADIRHMMMTPKGPQPGTAAAPLVFPVEKLKELQAPPSIPIPQVPFPANLVPRDQLTMQDIRAAMATNNPQVEERTASVPPVTYEVHVDNTFNVQAYDPTQAAAALDQKIRTGARDVWTQQIEQARARQKEY